MNTIRTTIVDGQVHVSVSDELPDGTEVVVQISTLGPWIARLPTCTGSWLPIYGEWDDRCKQSTSCLRPLPSRWATAQLLPLILTYWRSPVCRLETGRLHKPCDRRTTFVQGRSHLADPGAAVVAATGLGIHLARPSRSGSRRQAFERAVGYSAGHATETTEPDRIHYAGPNGFAELLNIVPAADARPKIANLLLPHAQTSLIS